MFATYDAAYASDAAFTIELWVKSAVTDPGEQCVASCVDVASPRRGWIIYSDATANGTFNFRTYNANGATVSDGSAGYVMVVPGGHIVANTWVPPCRHFRRHHRAGIHQRRAFDQ